MDTSIPAHEDQYMNEMILIQINCIDSLIETIYD